MKEALQFGKRLRELRIKARLTQRELAEKVGVDFSYLSKLENGVLPPPSEKVILKLAEILHTDKDELIILAGRIPADIAEMLKNQKTLQLLRSEHTRKKVMAEKEAGVSLRNRVSLPRMPVFNFNSFARIAVAIILVVAVGASLWFASPQPVKALEIGFPSLPSGNIGTSHSFSVTVTLGTQDLIPLQSANISIYKANDSTKTATLAGLPLNAGSTSYTSAATGGGAATVTATTATGWAYASGTGYAYWKGTGYSFGPTTWGYGYNPGTGTTSITYSISWTSPSSWPAGSYQVKVDLDASDATLTKTFTETSGSFSLTRASAPATPTIVGDEPPETTTEDIAGGAEVASDDGNVEVSVPTGTTGMVGGTPVSEISITKVTGPPAAPLDSNFIGLVYDLEPSGATFDEALTLTFNFNAAWLPKGADPETSLDIAYYDEDTGEWVSLDATDIVIDPINNTITAKITHFTYFAVLVHIAPAEFAVSNLAITPAEVDIAEEVNISATISNTGDLSGIQEVTLKINGAAVSTKRVTIGGRTSEKVSFINIQGKAGTYAVDISGLSGTFTVKTPSPKPVVITSPPAPATPVPTPAPAPVPAPVPTPTPVPAPEVNVWLLVIIAAATVIIVGGAIWLFGCRRGY